MQNTSGAHVELIDTCIGTRYAGNLIRTFRHRGLERLFQEDDASKVRASHVKRIADVLAHLDTAVRAGDVDLPGYRLHPLKGDRKGYWSVTISGNYRIVFRIKDGEVFDVDLLDYH